MTTILTASGMGLVVFVFSAVLMLAAGLEKSLVITGQPENAIFIRRASEVEVQSIVAREEAALLENLPDIAMGPNGRKMLAREVVILIGLKKLSTGSAANVTLRGISAESSLALRPRVKLIQGRIPRSGSQEIMIGRNIAARFATGGIGRSLDFGGRSWIIVGILDSGGSGFDSEIWCDLDVVMSAFRRTAYSSVTIRMSDPSHLAAIKETVLRDPRLTVDALSEIDYYAAQSRLMAKFIRVLGVGLTIIFSLGAVIGSMVTMYAAVANRTSEIGTLRALGFGRASILSAFLLESVSLGLLGGIMGLGAASMLDSLTMSTLNWQTFSELSFSFTLTRPIALSALAFSCLMGLIGGALPSVRAARIGIVEALRA